MSEDIFNQSWLEELKAKLDEVSQLQDLEALEKQYLGRKSPLKAAMEALGRVEDPARRKTLGKQLNRQLTGLESLITTKRKQIGRIEENNLSKIRFDLTKPGIRAAVGHHHPVITVMDDLVEYFMNNGFEVAEGPEIETDWYCFEALNIPLEHPARDMQDTFYLENGAIPRTHTSSVQIRYMENNQPPIRIISPGKAYRNEDEDATHSWSFYQLEGLVVDRSIHMGHLKGTLLGMMKAILGNDVEVRLRPNYFPYVEPAVEVDVGRKNPKSGEMEWLEMLGAGMVHAQVLRNVGIDPEEFNGFAFGIGIERLAVVKHGIPDLRELWRPDLKFLEQFV